MLEEDGNEEESIEANLETCVPNAFLSCSYRA